MRRDFRNGTPANCRISYLQKPTRPLQGHWRDTFQLPFLKPLLGNIFKAVFLRNRFGDSIKLRLFRWVNALCKQSPGISEALASSAQQNFGPAPEGYGFLFSVKTIVHAPKTIAVWLNQQIQPISIREFIGLFPRFCVFNRSRRKPRFPMGSS